MISKILNILIDILYKDENTLFKLKPLFYILTLYKIQNVYLTYTTEVKTNWFVNDQVV